MRWLLRMTSIICIRDEDIRFPFKVLQIILEEYSKFQIATIMNFVYNCLHLIFKFADI